MGHHVIWASMVVGASFRFHRLRWQEGLRRVSLQTPWEAARRQFKTASTCAYACWIVPAAYRDERLLGEVSKKTAGIVPVKWDRDIDPVDRQGDDGETRQRSQYSRPCRSSQSVLIWRDFYSRAVSSSIERTPRQVIVSCGRNPGDLTQGAPQFP